MMNHSSVLFQLNFINKLNNIVQTLLIYFSKRVLFDMEWNNQQINWNKIKIKLDENHQEIKRTTGKLKQMSKLNQIKNVEVKIINGWIKLNF